jgi:hypothetical protein
MHYVIQDPQCCKVIPNIVLVHIIIIYVAIMNFTFIHSSTWINVGYKIEL